MDPELACRANCELFGRFADQFESQIVPLWGGVYDSLLERADVRTGSKALDVGTGTGEVALRLGRRVGNRGSVVGIDPEDEMLAIARKKAKALRANNVKFDRMSAEKLNLPDDSFDTVVGNYSLCCLFDYEGALTECLRVLKPGGRLTYNHAGPGDPLEFQVAFKIFERYQTDRPTKKLKEIRKAELLQDEAVDKYRDPIVTLSLLRSLGYDSAEATLTQRVIKYKDPGVFVDRMLCFNWRNEAGEIPKTKLDRFRSEAVEALSALSTGPDFPIEDDMVFFTGLK